jgi:IS4 transposase
VSTVMSLSASKRLKRLRSLSASNKRIVQRSRLGVKEPLALWKGVRHQVIGMESQTWRCRITGKSIPFAHLNRGLRVSVDACDLVMQDERNGNVNGEFYQHHPEKVNLMPVCLITQNMCSL